MRAKGGVAVGFGGKGFQRKISGEEEVKGAGSKAWIASMGGGG